MRRLLPECAFHKSSDLEAGRVMSNARDVLGFVLPFLWPFQPFDSSPKAHPFQFEMYFFVCVQGCGSGSSAKTTRIYAPSWDGNTPKWWWCTEQVRKLDRCRLHSHQLMNGKKRSVRSNTASCCVPHGLFSSLFHVLWIVFKQQGKVNLYESSRRYLF